MNHFLKAKNLFILNFLTRNVKDMVDLYDAYVKVYMVEDRENILVFLDNY